MHWARRPTRLMLPRDASPCKPSARPSHGAAPKQRVALRSGIAVHAPISGATWMTSPQLAACWAKLFGPHIRSKSPLWRSMSGKIGRSGKGCDVDQARRRNLEGPCTSRLWTDLWTGAGCPGTSAQDTPHTLGSTQFRTDSFGRVHGWPKMLYGVPDLPQSRNIGRIRKTLYEFDPDWAIPRQGDDGQFRTTPGRNPPTLSRNRPRVGRIRPQYGRLQTKCG